jgi:hypothetical protein
MLRVPGEPWGAGEGVQDDVLKGRDMKSTPVLLAVLLLVHLSRADDSSGTEVAVPKEEASPLKSGRTPGKANLISLGSMAALIAGGSAIMVIWDPGRYASSTENFMQGTGGTLIASGIFLAPSVGQVWLGDYGHATTAALLRGSGLALVMVSSFCFCEEGDFVPGILLGLGMFSYGMAYSFVQPYRTHPRAAVRTSFAPALLPMGHGRLAPGLAARVAF